MSNDLQERRAEIERSHRVSRGIITNPGQFEDSPVYAAVLWGLMIEAGADETVDSPDGTYDAFRVDPDVVEAFPEDFDADDIGSWIVLSQSNDGFVNAELMTADEFNDFMDSAAGPDAEYADADEFVD